MHEELVVADSAGHTMIDNHIDLAGDVSAASPADRAPERRPAARQGVSDKE